MHTLWLILGCVVWSLLVGCVENRCIGDEDDGYCEGNVAHSCTLINDGHDYQWTQRTCEGKTPHCITGQNVVSQSGPVDATCSVLPDIEPLCYERVRPFCKGAKRLVCGGYGNVTDLDDDEACPQP